MRGDLQDIRLRLVRVLNFLSVARFPRYNHCKATPGLRLWCGCDQPLISQNDSCDFVACFRKSRIPHLGQFQAPQNLSPTAHRVFPDVRHGHGFAYGFCNNNQIQIGYDCFYKKHYSAANLDNRYTIFLNPYTDCEARALTQFVLLPFGIPCKGTRTANVRDAWKSRKPHEVSIDRNGCTTFRLE